MVRASLLYSYRCLAIPLNDNKNPAPFFLLCLQKEKNMSKSNLLQITSKQNESFKERFNNTEKLYHYTSFDNALKILATGRLKFSQLSNLNDVNEACRPEYIDVTNSQIRTSDLERSYPYLEKGVITKALQKFRQISLSMDIDNKPGFAISPMWGHYAQKGTGVCLAFDKNKLISKLKPDEYGPVGYGEEVDGSITIPVNNIDDCVNYMNTHRQDVFFKKSLDWSYEQEFRIVKLSKRKIDEYLDIKGALLAIIVYDFQTDKYENSIRMAQSALLNLLSDNKVYVCNYGSFYGDYSLSCRDETIWTNGLIPFCNCQLDITVN